jgi:hypothetical protein
MARWAYRVRVGCEQHRDSGSADRRSSISFADTFVDAAGLENLGRHEPVTERSRSPRDLKLTSIGSVSAMAADCPLQGRKPEFEGDGACPGQERDDEVPLADIMVFCPAWPEGGGH